LRLKFPYVRFAFVKNFKNFMKFKLDLNKFKNEKIFLNKIDFKLLEKCGQIDSRFVILQHD